MSFNQEITAIVSNKMHCTYAHFNQSNQIFYYGKGSEKRASTKQNRNPKWHDMAKDGYKVEMLACWPTNKEALEHEKFLIRCAREMGWDLANITAGGQGVLGGKHWVGRKHSAETKAKISASNKGLKRRPSVKFSIANAKTSNPQWKGYWITPEGRFDTALEASLKHNVNEKTIVNRCKGFREKLVGGVKFYPPRNGWSFEPKE